MDGSLGDFGSEEDPIIRSLGDVSFDLYFGASLHIIAGGAVTAGSIIISDAATGIEGTDFIRESVQLADGSVVEVDGAQQATVDIRAGVLPEKIGITGVTSGLDGFPGGVFIDSELFISQPPPDTTREATSADITIGDIWVQQPEGLVLITNQYFPNPSLEGGNINIDPALGTFNFGIDVANLTSPITGNSGSIIINSRENINLNNSLGASGQTIILANSFFDNANGGDITLFKLRMISLAENSFIFSDSILNGNAGRISIKANENIVFTQSNIGANIGNSSGINSIGQVGRVEIEGGSISFADSQLQAGFFTGAQGEGGLVSINSSGSIIFDQSGIFG